MCNNNCSQKEKGLFRYFEAWLDCCRANDGVLLVSSIVLLSAIICFGLSVYGICSTIEKIMIPQTQQTVQVDESK